MHLSNFFIFASIKKPKAWIIFDVSIVPVNTAAYQARLCKIKLIQ